MLKIFIGYDPKETIALHVLSNSIMRQASVPVSITPLVLRQLPLKRERDPYQSTEFSYSRFLVPTLCGFEGRALFMDCDMLVRGDIAEVFEAADPNSAVAVVKHDYVPKAERKFLDQVQSKYRRKNWSSVMLFNNARCRALTPEFVDTATGLQLHQFAWLADDEIAGLPLTYNHLVGEYEPNPAAKIVHFTLGTPCFGKYAHCEFADEWKSEVRSMIDFQGFDEEVWP